MTKSQSQLVKQKITDICFENGAVTKPMVDKLYALVKEEFASGYKKGYMTAGVDQLINRPPKQRPPMRRSTLAVILAVLTLIGSMALPAELALALLWLYSGILTLAILITFLKWVASRSDDGLVATIRRLRRG